MTKRTTTAERIRDARRRAGLTQEELAAAVRPPVTLQAVSGWERKGSIKNDYLRQLPDILGVTLGWLMGDDVPLQESPRAKTPEDLGLPTTAAHSKGAPHSFEGGARDLPIFASVQSARGVSGAVDPAIIGHTTRPPELIGVPDSYAKFIRDDRTPRRLVGETSCFHPHLPPRAGDIVRIIFAENAPSDPGQDLIGEFVKAGKTDVIIALANPAEELTIPGGEVAAVHVEVACYRRA